jgi:DNA-binding NarL/FixJ family response regulator
MRAEFLATRALVLAVLGDAQDACALAERAASMTSSIEVVALARCSRVIAGGESAVDCFAYIASKATWDPLISALRAWPGLLGTLVDDPSRIPTLRAVLARSADYDLARPYGIALPPRSRAESASVLSNRENEVLQLIRQGLTNQEIAKTLFISLATVKVHVRHILEKTGTRSRVEAVTRPLAED